NYVVQNPYRKFVSLNIATMKLNNSEETHVVLIGAGIMSATLAVLLRKLNSKIKISIYEKLAVISGESSDALNNAGTGHSGFCEMNYTPEDEKGNIDIQKAINVATSFEMSREFWAYLVETGFIKQPEKFIDPVAHMSFVWGEEDVEFLRKRWQKMIQNPLFKGMQFSEDFNQLKAWLPLIMQHRDKSQKVAATRMEDGTDVNFGDLTHRLIMNLL